jgi:hypothetical protein
MVREYVYIGRKELKRLLQQPLQRKCIAQSDDVLAWIKESKQVLQSDKTVIATFIIDADQKLWIADRHSEHVVCAAGHSVLSAGEITFHVDLGTVEVVEISNQSTGYCPEPESWWAVSAALSQLNMPHPSDFTAAYLFRRCDACKNINIIKDGWFECEVCQAPLNQQWNFIADK